MEPTRTAIVTGAAQGMGRAMALGLLRSGRRVAAVDLRGDALDALRASAAADGLTGTLLTIEADLAEPEAIDRVVATVAARLGTVDILVNNAGVGQATIRPDNWLNPLRFWEVTPTQWRRFVAVNTDAPFLLSRALAPGMIERRWGRIVNVTTSLDSMLRRGFLPYGPTKAASEAAVAVMAGDLEGTGVTANVLVPGGPTDTAFIPAAAGFDRSTMLRPEIMVEPLLWLVSDEAAGTTGRRFIAAHWDASLPGARAADKAGAPAAWAALGAQMIRPKWVEEGR